LGLPSIALRRHFPMPPDTLPSRLHDDASNTPTVSKDSRHATAGDLFFILLLIAVLFAIIGMVCYGVYMKVMGWTARVRNGCSPGSDVTSLAEHLSTPAWWSFTCEYLKTDLARQLQRAYSVCWCPVSAPAKPCAGLPSRS